MATGVTDFIKIDEVRAEIDSVYPKPEVELTEDLVVANNGYSHRLIGNTFEFLCRVWLYRNCNDVLCPERHRSWEVEDKDRWHRNGKQGKIPELIVVTSRTSRESAA